MIGPTRSHNLKAHRGSITVGGIVFVVSLTLLLVVVNLTTGGSGETPAALLPENGAPSTLQEAIDRGTAEGKPVVAIATASWCGPCKAYKSNTLNKQSVQDMLTSEAVTVMIDVDQNQADAQRLGVQSLPTTYIIDAGTVVASRSKMLSADQLTELLQSSTTKK